MKKISIYLEPELDDALDRVAAAEGLSKAALIRHALRRAVADATRRRVKAIGVGQGPGDVTEDVDRHLAETGFGL